MKIISLITFYFLGLTAFAQYENAPLDYPSAEFHQERREALRVKMPKNSVAVFFSNPIRNRANDVDYVYHQDPDFYYLTGYREPHGVLLIFSDTITLENGELCNEIIFVQENDPYAEMWNGKRLGTKGTKENLKIQYVRDNKDFNDFNLDYTSFSKVILNDPPRDTHDFVKNESDLYDLINEFKEKSDYPQFLNPSSAKLYKLIKASNIENSANVAQYIGAQFTSTPSLKVNPILKSYISSDQEQRLEIAESLNKTNVDIILLDSLMADLRQIKTPIERALIRKAVRISAIGQIEVMKAMKPGISETEIQGIHEFVFKKYGAEYEGYPSIVGAGHNGCILHYVANNKPSIEDGELILMDLGAEYRGYTADVTRTIPVNGKFSKEQAAIYQLVYDAQEAGIQACQVGQNIFNSYQASAKIIAEGLLSLGIIQQKEDYRLYLPHGTTHHIGLDVHDKGHYELLEEHMIITVEPGIYIPKGSPCDPKWWDIAIRIEDDIMITKDGPVNLSEEAPRSIQAIESMMKKESIFNKFNLPSLDN